MVLIIIAALVFLKYYLNSLQKDKDVAKKELTFGTYNSTLNLIKEEKESVEENIIEEYYVKGRDDEENLEVKSMVVHRKSSWKNRHDNFFG